MAKVIDITDKLSFDGNPSLKIKGKKLEVNGDAPTMLKIMSLMDADNPSVDDIMQAYDLIFDDKSRAEIEKLKLSFSDLMIVIQEAITLITGENSSGE